MVHPALPARIHQVETASRHPTGFPPNALYVLIGSNVEPKMTVRDTGCGAAPS
jgi:hypothetical protein